MARNIGEEWGNPSIITVGGGSNLPATNELPVDMYRKTWASFASLTPLISILSKLSDEKAQNFRIDWQEEAEIPTSVIVGIDLAAAGTALTLIDNATTLVISTILYNPRTYDAATVSATPTTDTAATIVRDAAGTTGAIWKSGDVLHVLPPAVAENEADVYRNVSVADSNVYNYTQLIRMQYSLTRVMNVLPTHFGGAGSKRQSLKQQKYREFRKKWEKMVYFGGRSSSGTAPATIRMAGGLVHYLRSGTLYKDFEGIMTETGFDGYLGDYRDQNPDATRVALFAAGNVLDIINYWGKGKVRISPNATMYGLSIDTYKARALQVDLIPLPLLTDSVTRGWGFILDLDRIKLRTLDPPTFYPDAKNVGQSEIIYDTYRVVTSMLIANESRHAMFVGAEI